MTSFLGSTRSISSSFHHYVRYQCSHIQVHNHPSIARFSTNTLFKYNNSLNTATYSITRRLNTQANERVNEEGKGGSEGKGKKGGRWAYFTFPALLLFPSTYLYWKFISPPTQKGGELEDTAHLYASKSTPELAFSLFILKLCSFESLVNYGPKLLEFAEQNHLAGPAHWVVKQTFFRNFVAGETVDECAQEMAKMKNAGVGVVLDYSVESGQGTKEQLDGIADHIIETIHLAGREPSSAFACLKVSGLTSSSLLEKVSTLLQYYKDHKVDVKALPFGIDSKSSSLITRKLPSAQVPTSPPPPLSPQEQQELREFMQRLDRICSESHKLRVPMLIDAEQSYYQPAIDLFALQMCQKYNKHKPFIYNTYQMYLRDSPSRLLDDIKNAKKDGYRLGVKLVRGAYMHSERERAQKLGYADPVNATIEDTHSCYEEGVGITLGNLDVVGVMVASHNDDTILGALDRVRELKLDPNSSDVQFAQLYGMGDHLTLLLVNNGQRVFKYVPFGPVEYVMPYLIRRMHENRGFIGSTSMKERQLLWKELKRRYIAWPGGAQQDNNKNNINHSPSATKLAGA